MLLLFDIDGTLVRVGGAGRRALALAFERLHAVPDAMARVRLDGSTDPTIVTDAFVTHMGRHPRGPEEIADVLELYLPLLEEELTRMVADYQVMPGADRIARAASLDARFVVGLATGNVEGGARLKLERAGLNPFFSFGGYGSDSASRAELVQCAIDRGQRLASERLGRSYRRDEVVVIGDTELDVAAARAVGALAVGVRAGSTRIAELEASKPDVLVDTLDSDGLWNYLGLSR